MPSRKPKNRTARALRSRLLKVLGNRCARCGDDHWPGLEIDHVDGITWNRHSLNHRSRAYKYWAEWRAGVRLQVLCSLCNASKGRISTTPQGST